MQDFQELADEAFADFLKARPSDQSEGRPSGECQGQGIVASTVTGPEQAEASAYP